MRACLADADLLVEITSAIPRHQPVWQADETCDERVASRRADEDSHYDDRNRLR
jgi:hypothetical protein